MPKVNSTSGDRWRRYALRTRSVRCRSCRWKGRRRTDVPEAEWQPCPRCGAALRGSRRPKIGDETILVQIRRLLLAAARDLDLPAGRAPSHGAYTRWARERGHPTGDQLRGRAGRAMRIRGPGGRGWKGSWSDALRGAGFELWGERWTTEEEVIADLRRVSAELVAEGKAEPNQCPTRAEYQRRGRIDHCTVTARLLGDDGRGSWHAVAYQAGLLPPRTTRYRMRSREAVVKDYRRLSRREGYEPGGPGLGQRKFEALAGYCFSPRFGSWADLVRDAGYAAREQPKQFARTHTEAA